MSLGQKCKQTWFTGGLKNYLRQLWLLIDNLTGCHSDIGGSYKTHELSDLTLIWMAVSITQTKLFVH